MNLVLVMHLEYTVCGQQMCIILPIETYIKRVAMCSYRRSSTVCASVNVS